MKQEVTRRKGRRENMKGKEKRNSDRKKKKKRNS